MVGGIWKEGKWKWIAGESGWEGGVEREPVDEAEECMNLL